jgi:hypothetical protein
MGCDALRLRQHSIAVLDPTAVTSVIRAKLLLLNAALLVLDAAETFTPSDYGSIRPYVNSARLPGVFCNSVIHGHTVFLTGLDMQ